MGWRLLNPDGHLCLLDTGHCRHDTLQILGAARIVESHRVSHLDRRPFQGVVDSPCVFQHLSAELWFWSTIAEYRNAASYFDDVEITVEEGT